MQVELRLIHTPRIAKKNESYDQLLFAANARGISIDSHTKHLVICAQLDRLMIGLAAATTQARAFRLVVMPPFAMLTVCCSITSLFLFWANSTNCPARQQLNYSNSGPLWNFHAIAEQFEILTIVIDTP